MKVEFLRCQETGYPVVCTDYLKRFYMHNTLDQSQDEPCSHIVQRCVVLFDKMSTVARVSLSGLDSTDRGLSELI